MADMIRFVSPPQPRAPTAMNCTGCPAPCCRRPFGRVLLSLKEAKELPFTLSLAQDLPVKADEYVAVLPRHPETGACVFVTETGKCSIWKKRPGPCRDYTCLDDTTPSMVAFVKERFKTNAP